METNYGIYGDRDADTKFTPSFDWPGGSHNFYLWEGRLWIGSVVGADTLVSSNDENNEWLPSDDAPTGWGYCGPGTSMYDINSVFDDLGNSYSDPIGIKVFQKALAWSIDGFDQAIAYQLKVVNTGLNGDLHDVYIAWAFDCDVSGYDATDRHLDDLVDFDGDTRGEWADLGYPKDEVTIVGDSILSGPDGIPDHLTVFGDESDERVLINGTMVSMGDTLLVPRNTSFIYDSDNPAEAGVEDDEDRKCEGFLGGRLIYAPPSSSDSVWVGPYGDTCRIIRPTIHQWWNWNSDPGTDKEKFRYMLARHVGSLGYHYVPNPILIGAPVFDYRFLIGCGPYDLAANDTLEFVYVCGVGQGLNGGPDVGWSGGAYKWGIRQVVDNMLQGYYMGSQHSDPIHPSAPSRDTHWQIPVPPNVPGLRYSASPGMVTLVWDREGESPDPLDGMFDFRGYRIYRSAFRVGNWQLLADLDSAAYWPNYPHVYYDTTVIKGVPYYYAVTAYDAGRPLASPPIPPLESGPVNYKKNDLGAEIPVYVRTPRSSDLSQVTVVPNPYLGTSSWNMEFGRGFEDKIQFMHLPAPCRILIYTLAGDLVQTLDHVEDTGDEYWDLVSRNDQDVVSGVYIYKVELFDQNRNYVDSKIGKFVILR
jgi:hypothetical protein